MSKYTVSLKNICENIYNNESGGDISTATPNTVISFAAPRIFNFDFPIFDDDYESLIEEKIIRHFYFREIGYETFGAFRLKLQDKMLSIMPALNDMYDFTISDGKRIFDFYDGGETRNVTEQIQGADNRETVTDGDKKETTLDKQIIQVTNGNKHGENDTPQNAIPSGWGNNTYLTNYSYDDNTQTRQVTNINAAGTEGGIEKWNRDDTTLTEEGTHTNTRTYVENVYKMGDPVRHYEFLSQMEAKITTIDNVLFEALEPLFMQIW